MIYERCPKDDRWWYVCSGDIWKSVVCTCRRQLGRTPAAGAPAGTPAEHDMGVLSAALFAVCRANLRCCIKTDLELILDDASLRNMIERWRSDARTTVLICMTSV